MKAIAINDFATDATVHQLPEPTPGPGEVQARSDKEARSAVRERTRVRDRASTASRRSISGR